MNGAISGYRNTGSTKIVCVRLPVYPRELVLAHTPRDQSEQGVFSPINSGKKFCYQDCVVSVWPSYNQGCSVHHIYINGISFLFKINEVHLNATMQVHYLGP